MSGQPSTLDAFSTFGTGYSCCFRKHVLLRSRRKVRSIGEESSTLGALSVFEEDCSVASVFLVQCPHLRSWSCHHGASILPIQYFDNGIAELYCYADRAFADSRSFVIYCMSLVASFSQRPLSCPRRVARLSYSHFSVMDSVIRLPSPICFLAFALGCAGAFDVFALWIRVAAGTLRIYACLCSLTCVHNSFKLSCNCRVYLSVRAPRTASNGHEHSCRAQGPSSFTEDCSGTFCPNATDDTDARKVGISWTNHTAPTDGSMRFLASPRIS